MTRGKTRTVGPDHLYVLTRDPDRQVVRRIAVHYTGGQPWIHACIFDSAVVSAEPVLEFLEWSPSPRKRKRERREKIERVSGVWRHVKQPPNPDRYFTARQLKNHWQREREEKLAADEKRREDAEWLERATVKTQRLFNDLFDTIKLFACVEGSERAKQLAVLGLPETASREAIRSAYRLLARQHHPDHGGDAEKFREVTNAYEKVMERGEA